LLRNQQRSIGPHYFDVVGVLKKTLKNQHAIPAQRDVQVCLA